MTYFRFLVLITVNLIFVNLIYAQQGVTHFLYPGVSSVNRLYQAPFTTISPVIDGLATDVAWEKADWGMAQVNTKIATDWGTVTPALPEGAFQGPSDYKLQYKILWDSTTYYMLLKIEDDVVIYSDYHGGYPGNEVVYPFAKDNNYGKTVWSQIKPATGAGNGTRFDAWRMDNMHIFMTWNNPLFEKSGNYVRSRDGIYHNVFPGAWKTIRPDTAKIVANKQNSLPARYNPKAAITHSGNITYIEMKDTLWSQIIPNRPTFGPVAKDTLVLNMQINDADGITNRRDYQLFLSTFEGDGYLTTKDWVKVVLKNDDFSGFKKEPKSEVAWFYPNPNYTGKLVFSAPEEIFIYDVQGKLLIHSKNKSSIDVSSLKTGLYIVENTNRRKQKLQIN